jgi:hypothetical protein
MVLLRFPQSPELRLRPPAELPTPPIERYVADPVGAADIKDDFAALARLSNMLIICSSVN